MKRTTALADAIRCVTAYTLLALDEIGQDGYDYQACVERVQQGMHEQVTLGKEYQKHLDARTLLDEIEVYTKTVFDTPTHALVEYWRLLPGEDVPQPLSGYRGFFDFTDAARDRLDEWPDAVYVSPECFDKAVKLDYRQSERYYSRCFNKRESEQ